MSQPFVGEIRLFTANFAPVGWEFCNGQLLSIDDNEQLFQLIGTTYGGDGEDTFGLPNLQSRIPIHQSFTFVLGQTGGEEEVTLTVQQIPAHSHDFKAVTNVGTNSGPANAHVAQSDSVKLFSPAMNTPVPLHVEAMGPAGGSQPHSNLQPYLCVSFIISLYGIYPQP